MQKFNILSAFSVENAFVFFVSLSVGRTSRALTDLRQVNCYVVFVKTDSRRVKCYMAFVKTDLRQVKFYIAFVKNELASSRVLYGVRQKLPCCKSNVICFS